ncbi:DUF1010 domain-containing protein [Escherichia coli]|uniref:DUF1010 domain-containing protein n=1 Tax=Escherichia coli TaxID=562 RepID=UPI001374CF88
MPAFEWVHVQLHQQKGMISLSPPTICNSASASSYRFCSAVPPRWRSVFSRLAPVAKFKLSVLASGSNISVKPTRILRSAYLAR